MRIMGLNEQISLFGAAAEPMVQGPGFRLRPFFLLAPTVRGAGLTDPRATGADQPHPAPDNKPK